MPNEPNSTSDWLPGEAFVASLQILLMDAPRRSDGTPDTHQARVTGGALLASARQLDEHSSYDSVITMIEEGVLVPAGVGAPPDTARLVSTYRALSSDDRARWLAGQSLQINQEKLREYAANLPARAEGPSGTLPNQGAPRGSSSSAAAKDPVRSAVATIIERDGKAQADYRRTAQPVSSPSVPSQPSATTVTAPGGQVPSTRPSEGWIATVAATRVGDTPLTHGYFADQPMPPSPGSAPRQTSVAAAAGQAPLQPTSASRRNTVVQAFATGDPRSLHDHIAAGRLGGGGVSVPQAALLLPPGAGTSPAASTRNQRQTAAARTLPRRGDSLAGSARQQARLLKGR
ncbi:hypothetical protein BN159_0163 [Streptomyces davaonensis JCM 4913]|uniref:Uncharacterized protein n=1 Tax=Streptomyces davaonensis (strain DSM 101723 / JCM 4913 / KCC S-0913 / 768) TaxID=1214101 RepID=K4QUJ6_STRDJ|nr:hypothetical protein BN159_0163 [Streptomyces davaonensis JCM 4913]